jgi:AbiV family abortive infection protein
MRKGYLSTESIEALRAKILQNARDLLDEAMLLFAHDRFPRAYVLAHLAGEELTKLPMIVRAACDAEDGVDVDWRKLRRRMNDHQTKLRAQHTLDYLFTDIRPGDSEVRDYEQALRQVPDQNAQKNASLYADIRDGVAVSPRDIIDRERARDTIASTNSRYAFFEQAEGMTRGKIKELAKSDEHRRFLDAVARVDGDDTAK